LLDVGIGHHDHMVFRATEGLYAFAEIGATLIDVLRDRCGSYKADGFDIRVLKQTIDRDLVALNNVKHAIR
jgi:hypothetical protein